MRALAHPTRVRMLHLLRTETLSASELGRRLRIRFGSAQYHLRTLERAGIARRVGERHKRGGVEVLFEVPHSLWLDHDAEAPLGMRQAVHHAYLAELQRRLDAAAAEPDPLDTERDAFSTRELELRSEDSPGRHSRRSTCSCTVSTNWRSSGRTRTRCRSRRRCSCSGSRARPRSTRTRPGGMARERTRARPTRSGPHDRSAGCGSRGRSRTSAMASPWSRWCSWCRRPKAPAPRSGCSCSRAPSRRFLGPLAGVVADRVEQRTLMVLCDIGNAAIFATIAWSRPSFGVLLALVAASAVARHALRARRQRARFTALVHGDDLLAGRTPGWAPR